MEAPILLQAFQALRSRRTLRAGIFRGRAACSCAPNPRTIASVVCLDGGH